MTHDDHREDWQVLGTVDPLWAVLVRDDGRHGRWDPDEFLETGRREVDGVLDRVRAAGLDPGSAAALDFGCGAGRVTQALRRHFDRVVGVDVSGAMLEHARSLDVAGACEFIQLGGTDLAGQPDGTFDLAYSALVLQHIPTPAARRYLAELVRVVRPGGVVAVQVATRPDRSLRGLLTRVLPSSVVRVLQRRVLGYPAPMDMYPLRSVDVVGSLGSRGRVVDDWEDAMYGGHWHYRWYVIERLGEAAPGTPSHPPTAPGTGRP
jgi:SAM-dependent methyltransferase